MLHLLTDYLPSIRRTLIYLVLASSFALLVSSSSTLAYSKSLTSGYLHPLPAILVVSVGGTVLPAWFLWAPKGLLGQSKPAKVLKGLVAELVCYGGLGSWLVVVTADLHADTPGLLTSCGGFTMCRLLTSVLSLCWITFLLLSLLFSSILLCVLYFSARQRHHSPLLAMTTSFAEVDWTVYASRHYRRRTGTVKRKETKADLLELQSRKEEEENRRMAAERQARQEVFVVMEDGDDAESIQEAVQSQEGAKVHRRRESATVVNVGTVGGAV